MAHALQSLFLAKGNRDLVSVRVLRPRDTMHANPVGLKVAGRSALRDCSHILVRLKCRPKPLFDVGICDARGVWYTLTSLTAALRGTIMPSLRETPDEEHLAALEEWKKSRPKLGRPVTLSSVARFVVAIVLYPPEPETEEYYYNKHR